MSYVNRECAVDPFLLAGEGFKMDEYHNRFQSNLQRQLPLTQDTDSSPTLQLR